MVRRAFVVISAASVGAVLSNQDDDSAALLQMKNRGALKLTSNSSLEPVGANGPNGLSIPAGGLQCFKRVDKFLCGETYMPNGNECTQSSSTGFSSATSMAGACMISGSNALEWCLAQGTPCPVGNGYCGPTACTGEDESPVGCCIDCDGFAYAQWSQPGDYCDGMHGCNGPALSCSNEFTHTGADPRYLSATQCASFTIGSNNLRPPYCGTSYSPPSTAGGTCVGLESRNDDYCAPFAQPHWGVDVCNANPLCNWNTAAVTVPTVSMSVGVCEAPANPTC